MMRRHIWLVALFYACAEPPTPPETPGPGFGAGEDGGGQGGEQPPRREDVGPVAPGPDRGTNADGGADPDLGLHPDGGADDDDAEVTVDLGLDPDAAPELDAMRGPERYRAGQIHSPITPYTAAVMREIATIEGDLDDHVFMKVGASSTVSRSTLHCFAGDTVDLAAHDHLQTTLEYFLEGDAAGATPFDRVTVAARSGHSAGWAITGSPSPMAEEIAAIHPRIAIVHYGTNDMGLFGPYREGLVRFHERMMILIETLADQGIVPVLTGITRRSDSASANLWVHTFNAAIRGMAQAWQVPFIDLYLAVDHLDRHGLGGDGLHLNGYGAGPCLLTEEGLQHGYNVRNLIVLEAFDRMRRVLFTQEAGLDAPAPPTLGAGTTASPFIIDALPFAHFRDTTASSQSAMDRYGCDDADESGPEYLYRYETDREVRLRAFVLDREGVDIDVHLLDETATAEGCLSRGHHQIEGTVEPGVYHFALDSWVDGAQQPQAGAYLFLLVECDPDDGACDTDL